MDGLAIITMAVELSDGFSAELDLNGSTVTLNLGCLQVNSPLCDLRLFETCQLTGMTAS